MRFRECNGMSEELDSRQFPSQGRIASLNTDIKGPRDIEEKMFEFAVFRLGINPLLELGIYFREVEAVICWGPLLVRFLQILKVQES